jgi:hypothetical protein
MQWREYLISEIQDKLKTSFKFYQTDNDIYGTSELKKLVKRFDIMFNMKIREIILKVYYSYFLIN